MLRAKMLANRRQHVLVLLDALIQVPARYQFTKLNLASPYMFLLQSSPIASFFPFCQFDSIVTNSYSLAEDFCRNIYIFSAYYLPSQYPTIRYLDLYANYSHAVTILLLPDSHALQWNVIISYYFVYYAKKIIHPLLFITRKYAIICVKRRSVTRRDIH